MPFLRAHLNVADFVTKDLPDPAFRNFCEFSLWCGAKTHHAVFSLSDDAADLSMAPQTKPFFALKSPTHQAAPPPEV